MNEQATMQYGQTIALKDWAKLHHVSVRTVHNYLAQNKLKSAHKIGNSWHIGELETPPTGGKPGGAGPTIVVGENESTRPTPAPVPVPTPHPGAALVHTPHTLIEGTQPLLPDDVITILNRSPLWIEPALAARLIGVTENALRHELADEYGVRKIGTKYLVPQWKIRREYERRD